MSMLSIFQPPTDEALAACRRYARRGDPRDFEILVHRYQAMVVATCARVLGKDAAQDAAQETFLKLARSAGTVQTNLGAWLHGCARRTSIDHLRRIDVRARAEHAACPATNEPVAPDESAISWRELRPLLDAAIAELSDADRELIITRFLMGRPQTEMARAARVSEGTMHRRINRALDQLRRQLKAGGLTFGGAAALSATLGHAQPAAAAPALTTSLMQVGLAGMAGGTAGTSAALNFPLIGSIAVIGLLGTAGGWLYLGGGLPSAAIPAITTTAVSAAPTSAARPTSDTPRTWLTGTSGDIEPLARLVCSANSIVLEGTPDPKTPPVKIELRIESHDSTTTPPSLKLRVISDTTHKDGFFGKNLGQPIEGDYTITGDRLKIRVAEAGKPPQDTMAWFGTRTRTGKGASALSTIAPPLQGAWSELPGWDLVIAPDDIRILQSQTDNPLFRFRVIDWTDTGTHARVQAICADSEIAPAMLGKRIKLLVRRDPNGWTLVHHAPASPKLDQWPAGFEAKPADQLRILTFTEEKR